MTIEKDAYFGNLIERSSKGGLTIASSARVKSALRRKLDEQRTLIKELDVLRAEIDFLKNAETHRDEDDSSAESK